MLKRLVCAGLLATALIIPTVEAAGDINLPTVQIGKGMSVTTALSGRRSTREFSDKALTAKQLSKIFWAANGLNRPDTGGRVNPAAHGEYIIDVYAIMSDGIYCYDPRAHKLVLIVEGDHRELASKKAGSWSSKAPLNLVYVAYTGDMKKAPHASDATKQARYVGVAAGTMAQSVALVLESEGLGGCVRGSVDEANFRKVAKLDDDREIILAQTIGALK